MEVSAYEGLRSVKVASITRPALNEASVVCDSGGLTILAVYRSK